MNLRAPVFASFCSSLFYGSSLNIMIFNDVQNPIRWLFLFHAFLGACALAILLIPLISKKGGKVHIRAGWIYTVTMIGVGASALMITPWRILGDANKTPSTIASAAFLFFIAIFTLNSLWYGLTVLKFKARITPEYSLPRILPPILVIFLGILIQAYGSYAGNILLIVFPILGFLTAGVQLKYWIKTPTIKKHWWYAHMDGMFAASIATVTAFLVTALPKVSEHWLVHSPLLWIAPGVIGGIILNRWKRSYRAENN